MAQLRDDAPVGPVALDIPNQPLDQALDSFAAASSLQIFYENSLTANRSSNALKGVFDPSAALRVMLRGSGLTARFIAVRTVSIVRLHDDDAAATKREAELGHLSYYGLLQAGVTRALCGKPETTPGSYHVVVQYWSDPTARIARVKLVGSTGSHQRDLAITDAIQHVVVRAPDDLPQPVTMTIEPIRPDRCGTAEAPRGP